MAPRAQKVRVRQEPEFSQILPPKSENAFYCIFALQFSKVRAHHGVPGVPCHGATEPTPPIIVKKD